ncbi:DUF1763-domain-containing protein [Delitschia confertaspora ATCC 74209]|uniref:DUF1763-domain-containing protein n=1 Tax=Delitschia confertaspora ATCC 74209 TaxID=1513339 RepID=A0A9P4JRH0_9PLEO|nr:DUF1763-domain-containing protein [Delitschia confertaspora ATCC 74209]
MSKKEVVHAYRQLYRQGLRAVQFSKPARYTLRDRLRHEFRKGKPETFNKEKVENTLEFLHYATTQNGLEHKIVKNLLFVWWHELDGRGRSNRPVTQAAEVQIRVTAFDAFNHTILMLNESMGLCLPSGNVRLPLV